jgi:hypothetical protein
VAHPEKLEKISKPIVGHWKNFTIHPAIHEYMCIIAVTLIKSCTNSLRQVNEIVEQVKEIVEHEDRLLSVDAACDIM